MPLQKNFNNEKWSFYHNLSSPNQKKLKISILDIFGPLRSNFWTSWFCVEHPNLDPTQGVALGLKGIYFSMWEPRVCSGPIKLKNSTPQDVVILASEPNAMLNQHLNLKNQRNLKRVSMLKFWSVIDCLSMH